MNKLPIYIMAGGRSRRFGSDKARALLAGEPLIRRIADRLNPVAASVTVVADVAEKYADLGLRTIADLTPRLGPLGGLVTAMEDMEHCGGGDWLGLCSCDLVGPEPNAMRRLMESVVEGAEAVAFKAERWEPLFAMYRLSAKPAAKRAIAAERLAMWRLLDELRAVAVEPGEGERIAQVNTVDDHRRASRALGFEGEPESF